MYVYLLICIFFYLLYVCIHTCVNARGDYLQLLPLFLSLSLPLCLSLPPSLSLSHCFHLECRASLKYIKVIGFVAVTLHFGRAFMNPLPCPP